MTSPPCFSPSQVSQLRFSLQLQEQRKFSLKLSWRFCCHSALPSFPGLQKGLTDIRRNIFGCLAWQDKIFNTKPGLITRAHYSTVLSPCIKYIFLQAGISHQCKTTPQSQSLSCLVENNFRQLNMKQAKASRAQTGFKKPFNCL